MPSLPRVLPLFISTLLLPFLLSACGASTEKEDVAKTVKIDPPELVLRNFYTALDNDDKASATALLSERGKLIDPKGGSLLNSTAALIQAYDGIAKFSVLKVGQEIIEVEHTEAGPGKEQRTVTVEFEITFNNGEKRRSESQLIYEQVNKPEPSEDDGASDTAATAAAAPAEFGWRVEGVSAVPLEG